MDYNKRIIYNLRTELEIAVNMLNSLGYFSCDECGEFTQSTDELCPHCQRKEEEATLIRERG